MLISLDLSAAFNTVDHTILLRWLQTRFGISGLALAWFHSYLEVSICPYWQFHVSSLCTTGIPQGSVISPMLFPNSSHQLHILSVHMASCSSSTLTTLSSMSSYIHTQLITILQLPNSSSVSRLFIPSSAITGKHWTETNPRQSCLSPRNAHAFLQLPLLSVSPGPMSRFSIRPGFSVLPLT